MGNKTVQGYPDGSQVDYYYDNENQIVEVVDPDEGVTKFGYDANGNRIFKEYPNYETTYSWDAEGNLLAEMQYNHGQNGSSGNNGNGNGNNGNGNGNGNNSSADLTVLFDSVSRTGNSAITVTAK